MQNDQKLDIKQIRIDQKEITVPVKFEVTPDKIGLVRYRLKVEPLGEEKNTENNEFSFALNVLKGQLQLGIVAQKPSFDMKFMKLILDNREELKTNLYLSPSSLQQASQTLPILSDSMDIIILFNVPPKNIQESLVAAFRRKPIPFIFFVNETVGPSDIKFLKSFIPITAVQSEGVKSGEYLVKRTGAGRLWSVLNNYAEDATNNMFWSKCPPIYYPFGGVELDDAGTIILETQAATPEPVVYRYMKAGIRGILFLGNGFWRWHFLLAEDRQFHNAWSEKIYNMTRWLTSGAAHGNVILTTHKNDFQTGEPIRLNVQVYDGAFNPVTDATVRLRISGAGQNYEVEAELTENSIYQGNIPSPGKGNFIIEAQAWRDENSIGIASKEIYISPVNAEYLSSRQDYHFLETLAKVSGAAYTTADSLGIITTQIDLTSHIKQFESNFELWYRLPVLLVLLSLLTAEWAIRKRKGLA